MVQRDKHEKALEVLTRLHRDPNDSQNTFANQELHLIVERCQSEKDLIRVDGEWRLFTKKANRKKVFIAWMVMVGGQNIGPLVINNYNVLLYRSLGLGTTKSLLLSAVYNTIGLVIACIGGLISDRLGRRRAMGMYLSIQARQTEILKVMIVTGYVLIACVFATLTGMIAKYNTSPTKNWAAGATAMIYLYVVW